MMHDKTNERQAISALQGYLRQLAFDDPTIPLPPVDGIFDTRTEQALKAYQERVGLAVTGIADADTWNRLFSDYLASLERNRKSEGFDIFPSSPQGFALYPNDEQFAVEVVQFILNELRLWYDDIPQNGQSGIFDEVTRQGVVAFRRRHGLGEASQIDRATWNELVRTFRRLNERAEQ